MEVAIESTPSWYWLYDCLENEGFDVKLSHPLRTKAIAYAKVKTDKVDLDTLAYLLRSDLLPFIYGMLGPFYPHVAVILKSDHLMQVTLPRLSASHFHPASLLADIQWRFL